MLPAEQGDAIWITYGSSIDPHHLLVDTGIRKTYDMLKTTIEGLPVDARSLDLLVITHVDSDHIGAAPKLLADDTLGFRPDDVWFNAWRHLPQVGDRLGPVEGEMVSAELDELGWPWNAAFDGKAVVTPPKGRLPTRTLAGGMKLTVLSPTASQLEKLRPVWEKVVRKAGLDPGVPNPALREAAQRRGISDLMGDRLNVRALASTKTQPDTAPANGSTIAVLAEYGDVSCILAGDAHPDVLQQGLERLCRERGVERLRVDALKVPHHGSKFNVRKTCLDLIDTRRYLFSTSGKQTDHPDPEGVARVIMQGDTPTLYFNYRVDTTAIWDNPQLRREYRYRATYPDATPGLVAAL